MAKLSNENLFLLEFLIEDLHMSKCDCSQPSGEFCICFKFLDNSELDVCERDFNPDKKFSQKDSNRTGKSCLFSLTPSQAQAALQNFDLTVNVCKKMQPGWDPERICVGSVAISVLELLMGLIQDNEATPAAKVLQDKFELKDGNGQNVGTIGVYIRMSCYGKMIITQFQMNLEDKSVVFKDKEGRSMYRYKKSKKKGKPLKIEDVSQNEKDCDPKCKTFRIAEQAPSQQTSPNPNCPSQPCYPNGPPDFNNTPPGFGNFQPNFGNPQAGFGSAQSYSQPNTIRVPSLNLSGSMHPFFSSGLLGSNGGPSPLANSGMGNANPFGGLPASFGTPPNFGGQAFPPQNQNCPTQPCFPDDFGAKSKSHARSAPHSLDANLFYSPYLGPQTSMMPMMGSRGMQTTKFSVGLGDDGFKTGGCGGGCGR